MTHLVLLTLFCLAQIAVGLAIGRRVQSTSDFFVAGRRLGPMMLFSTMIAANIGAGSTVGAAGYGYRDGLSAWWWVGSAAVGSIVLGLWVGPRIRAVASAHDLHTLGDFLEWRYDWRVRAAATTLLWLGTLAILAGQLLALAFVLQAVAGWPHWVGCLVGGVVMTIYFSAGGMLSSIWVNLVQLVVLIVGFAVAMPYAFGAVGGWDGLRAATDSGGSYWSLWRGGASGWIFLAMLAPSFFLSPGLLQKVYGARDDRTVRIGVLANAAVLFLFAFVPVLLGMIARALHPALANRELALPMLLVHDLPVVVGSLGLAALVAAEVSTADAILFMLSTSLSRDLYKRFLRPAATDADVLRVARLTAVVAGVAGVGLAMVITSSVAAALGTFYTMLSVSLFVPILGGLFWRALGARQALVAMIVGVLVALAAQFVFPRQLPPEVTPAMVGIAASVSAAAAASRRVRPGTSSAALLSLLLTVALATPAAAQELTIGELPALHPQRPVVERPVTEEDIPPASSPTWRGAFEDSLRLLALEHGIRVAFQDKTRRELGGAFFKDYRRSVRWPETWEDGDSSFVNYIGHPIHGAAAGFLWLDHEDGAHDPELRFSWAYWASRGRATAWAAGYSVQFEFGPLSEASIGNVGLRPETTGWVDHVVTPAGALGLMVAEDALDRYFIQFVERRTSNRVFRASMRMLFNPSRTMSNTAQGRTPWHRPTRPLR